MAPIPARDGPIALPPTQPKKKKKRAVIGTKPKRVMGLSPEDAPMAWFAAAAVEQLPQTLYRCAGKSGGIVRAGVEKTSGALLKLAFGMEVVVDGAAAASDGTRRLAVGVRLLEQAVDHGPQVLDARVVGQHRRHRGRRPLSGGSGCLFEFPSHDAARHVN